jgi:hypothetical protein
MGQFYKGTAAEFLDDKMFVLPFEQMKNVIEKKDKETGEAIESAGALADLLKAQTLDADKARANQIISGYSKNIDDITNQIIADPLNAALYNPKIKNLSRGIKENWERGEIAAMQGNYTAYQAWEKELAEKMKKDPKLYDAKQAEDLKKMKLAEFTKGGGTKWESPTKYSSFDTEELAGLTPFQEFTENLMRGGIKGVDKTISWDNDRGEFRVAGKSGVEYFTEKQLENMYKTAIATDPNVVSGIKQRELLGSEGFAVSNFDENGNPVFASNNYLGQGLENLKEKYGGKKIVSESSSHYNDLFKMNEEERKAKIKELEETEYINETVKETGKTFAGDTMQKQTLVVNSARESVNSAVDKGVKHAFEQSGFKGSYKAFAATKAGSAIIAEMQAGDFSGVQDPVIRKQLSSQYKQGKLITNHNAALEAQFNREYAHLNYDLNRYRKGGEKNGGYSPADQKKVQDAWGRYLRKGNVTTRDAKLSYEDTGMVQKDIDQVNKGFFGSSLHLKNPMGLKNGTKIGNFIVGQSFRDKNTGALLPFTVNEKGQYVVNKGAEGYFDYKDGKPTNIKAGIRDRIDLVKNPSINDLVTMGVVKPKANKRVTGTDANSGEDTFEIVEGGGHLNVDIGKGVLPDMTLNDDDRVNFHYKIGINGVEHDASTGNFGTASTDAFMAKHGDKMRVIKYFRKLGGAEKVSLKGVVPDGEDMVYHGKTSSRMKADGTPEYRAGEITLTLGNKRVTTTLDNPEVMKRLSEGFKAR